MPTAARTLLDQPPPRTPDEAGARLLTDATASDNGLRGSEGPRPSTPDRFARTQTLLEGPPRTRRAAGGLVALTEAFHSIGLPAHRGRRLLFLANALAGPGGIPTVEIPELVSAYWGLQ